jgi:peptidyl-prolyl cis-trans isomerase D
MSIMESMRSGSESASMQIVVAMAVVAFMFWGVGPQGDTTAAVVTVNGEQIMDTEFRRAYSNEERYREDAYGRVLSDPEKEQLRNQVKDQLVEREVIRQQAEGLGLVVSDSEVARQVADIPAFQDDDGVLDIDLYARYLKRIGYTRSGFEERRRDDLLRLKLRQLIYMGATVSEPVVRDSYVEANTKLDLQTVRVRPTMFYSKIEVSEEDVTAWLADNAEKAKEIYDRDFERLYNHPEEVQVSLIQLAISNDGQGAAELLPRMRDIKKAAEEGGDFTALAKKWSEDRSAAKGGDLGMRPLSRFDGDEIDALRDLEIGAVSKVLPSESEIKLFRLDGRKEASVELLEDVQRDIATQALKEERAPAMAAELAEEQVLKQWREAGGVPNALLEEAGLVATGTGLISAKGTGGPFEPPAEMLKAASAAEVGAVLDDVYEADGVLWLGSLSQRVEADMEQYEREKDQIRESALAERRSRFFQAWISDAVEKADIQ